MQKLQFWRAEELPKSREWNTGFWISVPEFVMYDLFYMKYTIKIRMKEDYVECIWLFWYIAQICTNVWIFDKSLYVFN